MDNKTMSEPACTFNNKGKITNATVIFDIPAGCTCPNGKILTIDADKNPICK